MSRWYTDLSFAIVSLSVAIVGYAHQYDNYYLTNWNYYGNSLLFIFAFIDFRNGFKDLMKELKK